MSVAIIRNPMNCFAVTIHSPGFGRYLTQAGFDVSRRYGSAIPNATVVKMSRIIHHGCANANPSAVPKNGAVQGVARIVANTPSQNEAAYPFPSPVCFATAALTPVTATPGSLISNTSKRLRPNANTTTDIAMTNRGSWN